MEQMNPELVKTAVGKVLPDIIREYNVTPTTQIGDVVKQVGNTVANCIAIKGYFDKGCLVEALKASYPYLERIAEKFVTELENYLQTAMLFNYIRVSKIDDFILNCPDMSHEDKIRAFKDVGEQEHRHKIEIIITALLGSLGCIGVAATATNKNANKTLQTFKKEHEKTKRAKIKQKEKTKRQQQRLSGKRK